MKVVGLVCDLPGSCELLKSHCKRSIQEAVDDKKYRLPDVPDLSCCISTLLTIGDIP